MQPPSLPELISIQPPPSPHSRPSNVRIDHPYARIYAKKEGKRRRIWNHAFEKSLFTAYELSTLTAPTRRTIYVASLETHINRLHGQLMGLGHVLASEEQLDAFKGVNSKTIKSIVSGLQFDVNHTKLKLLELERANQSLRQTLGIPEAHTPPSTFADDDADGHTRDSTSEQIPVQSLIGPHASETPHSYTPNQSYVHHTPILASSSLGSAYDPNTHAPSPQPPPYSQYSPSPSAYQPVQLPYPLSQPQPTSCARASENNHPCYPPPYYPPPYYPPPHIQAPSYTEHYPQPFSAARSLSVSSSSSSSSSSCSSLSDDAMLLSSVSDHPSIMTGMAKFYTF